MKIYAEVPSMRLGQVLNDLALVVWCVMWVWAGMWVHDLFIGLAAPGELIERAGVDLEERLLTLGSEMSEVPVVGSELNEPFEAASEAGRSLAAAGQAQQDAVHTVALWLGVLFALLPILFALVQWLPGRIRWIREASAADRVRIQADDLYLFALRAAVTRPLPELLRATPNPAAALASGDFEPLAELELRELGLSARR